MNGDRRNVVNRRLILRVIRISFKSATPPPRLPGMGVPSRRISHQDWGHLSSGTDARSLRTSGSEKGNKANSCRRSMVATTLAAQRQNLQSSPKISIGRGKLEATVIPIFSF
jgi:hypothetical protein